MTRYVLDSFAVIAYFQNEPGASQVARLLDDPEQECWLSSINRGEVFYSLARRIGLFRAEQTLDDLTRLEVRVTHPGEDLVMEAAMLKASYALSYADCFAAALGARLGAAVVTGDAEFEQLEAAGVVTIEWLPPRPGSRRRRRR